jgi:hypothetical protein
MEIGKVLKWKYIHIQSGDNKVPVNQNLIYEL